MKGGTRLYVYKKFRKFMAKLKKMICFPIGGVVFPTFFFIVKTISKFARQQSQFRPSFCCSSVADETFLGTPVNNLTAVLLVQQFLILSFTDKNR